MSDDYTMTCKTCRWRSRESNGVTTGASGSAYPPEGTPTYYCHRYPPNGYWDKLTMVLEIHWCGEYKKRATV